MSKHNVFYGAIHSINTAALMTDMLTSDLVTHPKEHVSDLHEEYCQIPKTLLDKHAPIKSKSMSQKLPAPWMAPEIIKSKRCHCYLEHVWGKSRSSLDSSHYSQQCHQCNRQIKQSDYYKSYQIKSYTGGVFLLYQHQTSHYGTLCFVIYFKDKN